jgi:hypothetical protein
MRKIPASIPVPKRKEKRRGKGGRKKEKKEERKNTFFIVDGETHSDFKYIKTSKKSYS